MQDPDGVVQELLAILAYLAGEYEQPMRRES
jgi:hypothetical protein